MITRADQIGSLADATFLLATATGIIYSRLFDHGAIYPATISRQLDWALAGRVSPHVGGVKKDSATNLALALSYGRD